MMQRSRWLSSVSEFFFTRVISIIMIACGGGEKGDTIL